MSIELKTAAQQVVDAFDAFGDADDFASLFELTQKVRALRTAIQQAEAQQPTAQDEQEANGLPPIVAGAIFDFAGFMTTRSEVIEVGSTAEAGPVADLVKEWAELRGLDIANAAVLSWQLHITRASLPATGEPVQADSSEHLRVIASLGAALRRLSFAAQTTGGTNGPDAELQSAIGQAEQALSLGGIRQAMSATTEPVVSRNPFASRCYTMSESHLSGHRLIVGFEKLGDVQDAHEWVARQGRGDFTHPAPSVPHNDDQHSHGRPQDPQDTYANGLAQANNEQG